MDFASTTPVDPEVLAEMLPYFLNYYGNPSSLHQIGRKAKEAVSNARKTVSSILNCTENEIVFTSGGTESDNIAILGHALYLSKQRSTGIFACSEIEHHAIINSIYATKQYGFEPFLLPVNRKGIVNLKALENLILSKKVCLVSIMYANNEIGTIQPINKIAKLCRKNSVVFHTDACQASPYLSLDVKKLGIDMMSLNGSKMYGPKGVGLVYIKKATSISQVVYGGGQEKGIRSGTENVPGVVGLAKALSLAQSNISIECEKETKLRDKLITNLLDIPKVVLNGSKEERLPNNVNLSFLGVEGEAMLLELDKCGICVSTGSACSSNSLEPSHVILAIHKDDSNPHSYAHSSIRFTIGKYTTEEEIEYTILRVREILTRLRSISSTW